MKKIIYLFCLPVILYTGVVFGQADEALFLRSVGKLVPVTGQVKNDLWKHGEDFTTWNTFMGSQNIPVIAEAAIGRYKWVVALCKYEKQEGMFGRELGSAGFYYSIVVASKMIALREARAANDQAAVKEIAESLRAVWAYDALTALATPRTDCWADEAGYPININSGDQASYNGLTCAIAGERWRHGAWDGHDHHGEYLSWALDWQPRKGLQNILVTTGLWQNMVGQLGKNNTYVAAMDPEIFGITAADRAKLQQVANGDIAAAQWAASVVAEYGVFKDVSIRMRRTSNGTECIYFKSCNNNKPTQAATTLSNTGVWKSISPGFENSGLAGYKVWLTADSIYATCDPGFGSLVGMKQMDGNLIWQVEMDGKMIKFNGNVVTPAAPINWLATQADAGITAVTYPGTVLNTVANDSINPIVILKNFGTQTLNTVYILCKYNADTVGLLSTWKGILAPGATTNVTLLGSKIPVGQNKITVSTGSPNYLEDASTANNIHTVNFVYGSSAPNATDANMLSVVDPLIHNCSTIIVPKVNIRNEGPVSLTNLILSYKIDNGTVLNKTFTSAGGLAVGNSITLSMDTSTVAVGVHTLKTWVDKSNNLKDLININDTLVMLFRVVWKGVATPLTEGFETSVNLPTNWTSINIDAVETWDVTNSAAFTGTSSIYMNNYGHAGANNTRDELAMPIQDLTTVNNPELGFKLSHASKTGLTAYDSLEVLISGDCGATFTQVWAKGGAALNTKGYVAGAFTPATAADWRDEKVSLVNYAAKTTVLIKFVQHSQGNNNLFIDNINIGTGAATSTSILTLQDQVILSPNPGSGIFTLQFPSFDNKLQYIVYDVFGKCLQSGVLTENTQLKLDHLENGVYLVSIHSDDGIIANKKVVIRK